jgi:hypothetical protein
MPYKYKIIPKIVIPWRFTCAVDLDRDVGHPSAVRMRSAKPSNTTAISFPHCSATRSLAHSCASNELHRIKTRNHHLEDLLQRIGTI